MLYLVSSSQPSNVLFGITGGLSNLEGVFLSKAVKPFIRMHIVDRETGRYINMNHVVMIAYKSTFKNTSS